MTGSSLVLLAFFLIAFAVGMRAAGKAQKKAQHKARQQKQPLPPPAKGFSSDFTCMSMSGAASLGTLAVTSYVASSTINQMQKSEAADPQAPPTGDTTASTHQHGAETSGLNDSVTSGTDMSDGFSDGFLDTFDDLW